MDEWIKVWYTHTCIYTHRETHKHTGILPGWNIPFATTWLDFKGTMGSDMSEKNKGYMISLGKMWNIKKLNEQTRAKTHRYRKHQWFSEVK